MTTLSIRIDTQTEAELRRLVGQDGNDLCEVAARLLARAVRAARPRVHFDPDAIRTANATFTEDDDCLAESAGAERLALLVREDAA
jgi:hypothetical protein